MNFSGMGVGAPVASKYTRWPSHSPLAAAAKSASSDAGEAEARTDRARPEKRDRVPIFEDREGAPVAPAGTRADAVDAASEEKALMAGVTRCGVSVEPRGGVWGMRGLFRGVVVG
jgi:hypothetical protein